MQKIILITGVSSGFGRAIAERLLGDGHIVYGTSRRELDFSSKGLSSDVSTLPTDTE